MPTDEKIHALEKEFREWKQSSNESIGNLGEKAHRMELDAVGKMSRIETQLESISSSLINFVHQHQFAPVRLIVYGLAAGVMTTVLGAIMAKVVGLL